MARTLNAIAEMGIFLYFSPIVNDVTQWRFEVAKNEYKYGRSKEMKVAQSLRNRGASVKTSKGSKGAADLTAKFPSGTKWQVQVKSTRSGNAASPSVKDTGRLKQSATKRKATAVIAKVSPKGVKYESARTGRSLTPPKSRKK